jgi:hypothetical protein
MAGHLWAYRIGGAALVWLLAVLVGTDIGLLLAGRDADLRPQLRLHRALVLVGLGAAVVLALVLQEILD